MEAADAEPATGVATDGHEQMFTAVHTTQPTTSNALAWVAPSTHLAANSVAGWSCRLAPTSPASNITGSPMSDRAAAGPMPDSISIWGVATAPPHMMTSPSGASSAEAGGSTKRYGLGRSIGFVVLSQQYKNPPVACSAVTAAQLVSWVHTASVVKVQLFECRAPQLVSSTEVCSPICRRQTTARAVSKGS